MKDKKVRIVVTREYKGSSDMTAVFKQVIEKQVAERFAVWIEKRKVG